MIKEENKLLPTGKKHVSFSEIKAWKECSWRHKLIHIDKVDVFEPSPYLDFGTAVHEGCETLLETKTIDKEKLLKDITDAWEKNGFDDPEWVEKQPGWYKYHPVDTWCGKCTMALLSQSWLFVGAPALYFSRSGMVCDDTSRNFAQMFCVFSTEA